MTAAGWPAEEAIVRALLPAARRGNNVVAIVPPAPAWASAVLAGVVGATERPGPVLLLSSAAMVGEWAVTAGALFDGAGFEVEVLRDGTPRPAGTRRPADLVVGSPEAALAEHSRSALHPDRFAAIIFAWPEQWASGDALAAILQDTPRDAQRIVLTSGPQYVDGSDGVVEQYARKALVVNPLQLTAEGVVATSVRTMASSWANRAASLATLVDAQGGNAVIWTADSRDHALIRRTLGSLPASVALSARDIPSSGAIICYDPPTAATLGQLAAIGEVTLLTPPGTETYLSAVAPTRRPWTVGSAAAVLAGRDGQLRQQISRAVESRQHGAALYALAPLFEQFDPQQVAAALFDLWQRAGQAPVVAAKSVEAVAAQRPAPSASRTAKLWIGAGKKDDATVADFVAVLVREAGMDRANIGRIELRDAFALVEVPAVDAEILARRVTGLTIRKRKLQARVDGQPEAAPSTRRANPAPPKRRPPPR
jgi:hypothetical protein